MNLQEIKQAIEEGKKVFWRSELYEVKKCTYESSEVDYNIICNLNDHCIGLTWRNGVTLNGEEKDFFVK